MGSQPHLTPADQKICHKIFSQVCTPSALSMVFIGTR
jgi:hypothetical protein